MAYINPQGTDFYCQHLTDDKTAAHVLDNWPRVEMVVGRVGGRCESKLPSYSTYQLGYCACAPPPTPEVPTAHRFSENLPVRVLSCCLKWNLPKCAWECQLEPLFSHGLGMRRNKSADFHHTWNNNQKKKKKSRIPNIWSYKLFYLWLYRIGKVQSILVHEDMYSRKVGFRLIAHDTEPCTW